MSNLSNVIVGGPVVFNPTFFGEVLRGSCFYMHYDQKSQSAKLFHNNGESGGRDILTIKNVSHESVAKLAKGMGLKSDRDRDRESDSCCFWSISIPIIHLYHDGSEDAEKIRLEACRLNMECRVVPINGGPWHLNSGIHRYSPDSPFWSADNVIKEMRNWAKMWNLKSYLKEPSETAQATA